MRVITTALSSQGSNLKAISVSGHMLAISQPVKEHWTIENAIGSVNESSWDVASRERP